MKKKKIVLKNLLLPNETGKCTTKDIAIEAGLTEEEAKEAEEGLIRKGLIYKTKNGYGMKKDLHLKLLLALEDEVN